MSIKSSEIFVVILLTALALTGCTLANRKITGGKIIENETLSWDKGKGDAYLFDVKIYRGGRKNSVRLDVYLSDDKISLFARGYLGKGVLKGLILPDSIITYFPTEKEYYAGRMANLINNGCADSLSLELTLIELFQKTPAEIEHDLAGFYVVVMNEENKVRRYRLESQGCPEGMEISYTLKSGRFIPDEIDYTTADDSFRLKAERRRAKLNIDIPEEKFQIDIPAGTVRTSP